MNPRPLAIRRLVIFISLCLMLGKASVAFAQSTPFKECPDAPKGFDTMNFVPPDGWHITKAHIDCNGTVIFADDVTWDAHKLYAKGNVLVTQKDLRINADRMEMDLETKLAVFFEAYGTATLAEGATDRSLFGSFEPQVWFRASRLERIGPRAYKLTNGVFSTCTQPNARWEMRGTSGTVILDDHASMRNVQFRVKGVPVIYLPYLYYPMKKEDRSTGFLIPSYSNSSLRGQGISNAFFWAINRSMDATFNHDYFSKTGQGFGAEYRYVASNTSQGNLKFYGLDEKERLKADGTVERQAHVSYRFDGGLNQRLGSHFSLGGSTNYSTDITSQQLYQQNVYDLTNRNRYLDFSLQGRNFSGPVGRRLNLTVNVNQYDSFTGGTSQGGRSAMPKVSFYLSAGSLNGSKLGSKILYSGSAEVGRFELRVPAKPTLTVSRMDATGTVSAPLSTLQWLSVYTSTTARVTEWLDTIDPLTGLQTPAPLTRSLFNFQASVVGPMLFKVFLTPKNRYAQGFRHSIAPSVRASYWSPFDQAARIITVDPTDTIVGGTTSVDYALTNTVTAHIHTSDGRDEYRPILTVTLGQSYRTNATAGAVDPLYPNPSAGKLSPVQFVVSSTPARGTTGTFSLYYNSASWPTLGSPHPRLAYNASTTIRAKQDRLNLTAGWSKTDYLTAAEGFVDLPTTQSAFANASVRLGGVGVTYAFNLDVPTGRLVQQRVIGYYHAQCCGIAFDYQEVALQLSTVPTDRRFAVTFTLAGIGSFSPPLGAFK